MKRKLAQEDRDSIQAWLREVEKFDKLYPKACPFCHGWGFSLEGPLKVPVTCPDCVGQNICPLCESPLESIPGSPYISECTDPDCGWKENGNKDGCDDPPNCTDWFSYHEAKNMGFV